MRSFAIFVASFFQVAVVFAQPPSRTNVPEVPTGLVLERDIAYRAGSDRWLLNVIRPKELSEEPRTAILLVHGGGWSTGDHYRFTKMGFDLGEQGYVVVTPTYRMIKDGAFPACLHDVKNAIRWIRAHADRYNIDPKRIGAYGNSAGGTLVLTAAITNGNTELEGDGTFLDHSSALQAVVCSGAVGDMAHPNHSKLAKTVYRNLAGALNRKASEESIASTIRMASPSSYITKSVPPILMIHGGKDKVVFVDSTDEFVEKMRTAGASVSYLRFADAGHAVMGQKVKETRPAMEAFFKKHL